MKIRIILSAACFALTIAACATGPTEQDLVESTATVANAIDLQGHRGARGLAPENTLPAFAKALSLGVTTLELDVGVTSDGELVVAHGPTLNADVVRSSSGEWVSEEPVVYHLTFAKLQRFDVGRLRVGSEYAERYPKQQEIDRTRIPTLKQVFDLVQKAGNEQVWFNIEPKTDPTKPDLTPSPDTIADAVVLEVRKAGMASRAIIQSFDWRTLRHVQMTAPEFPTAYLSAEQKWFDNIEQGKPGASPWTAELDVDDFDGSIPRLVSEAGGKIWSPYYEDLRSKSLEEAHALSLKVIVWTVNKPEDMTRLIDMGVDGIITDRPDILRKVMQDKSLPLPEPTPVAP